MHYMTSEPNISSVAQNVLETCMCHKTRMAARAITRAYDEALRATGLRATQVAVMTAVAAKGALSIKSLADSLAMDRTTLTRNLRPLEERGLIFVAPERRYRSRMLSLTASGHAALLEVLPLWEGAQRTMKQRLGDQRWTAVQQAVSQLAEEIQQTSGG